MIRRILRLPITLLRSIASIFTGRRTHRTHRTTTTRRVV
jgi:hypothetical protein